MDNILFTKKYDSESIADLYRDVSEAFNVNFNDDAKNLTEGSSVLAHFYFVDENGQQELLKSTYYPETYFDIEQDLGESFENLHVKQDKHGFFEGELVITITIQ